MFQKGNKLGIGRPKISLTKPELLLPAVLAKSSINWANDFCKLYKIMRDGKRSLDQREQEHLKFLLTLMPYLCTKVQLKEIDGRQMTTPAESMANAKQTSELLKALENESTSQTEGH